MAKKRSGLKSHSFRNKLLLNQWLLSLFGIDPIQPPKLRGETVRPFHLLADPIKDPRLEGLDADNLHNFYHSLVNSNLFWNELAPLSKEQLLVYEENIVRHTQTINEKRRRPIVWKYYQWLTLLFVEIYLDRYFGNREALLTELNAFVTRFNNHWQEYVDVPPYTEDDLNKLCLQNATGSGKTLLMNINLLQYRHYAARQNKANDLSRVILLTPNERLSEQHITEFQESGIAAQSFIKNRGTTTQPTWLTAKDGLNRVDVLEITKLAEQEGPNTVATRSLGDQNLLLVDEGHRGMSGTEEGVWFTRR
ncbi:MAG TPA: DEAD/DEAH box helicase family protein, partial [Caldilineaceae bacterium]|nr:DEAD/DEAH box helicase family protein [Caldilineaceae bacterium]